VGDEVVSVANFSVAVTNPQGSDLPPTWIRVTVWRNYAEIVAQYVHKGVIVTDSSYVIRVLGRCWKAELYQRKRERLFKFFHELDGEANGFDDAHVVRQFVIA